MAQGDVRSVTDHWWWRPGWEVGTRFLTWHVVLEGQDAALELVGRYQDALRDVPVLDPVPARWLHLTVSGLGDVQHVTEADRDGVVEAVRARLAAQAPFDAELHSAVVGREAVVLPTGSRSGMAALREAIIAATADTLGRTRVIDQARDFAPHVSVAYANAEADAAPIRAALDGVEHHRTVLHVAAVHLIALHRDDKAYEWETVARVPLGG